MREIEFRGKSIGGEWVYGVLMPFWNRDKEIKMYCIIPYNIGLIKDTSIWEIQIQVDPDTIGQFTGIKDCNGVKIYEGDILKCLDPEGDDYLSFVRYDDGAFIIDVQFRDYDCTAIGWALASDLDGVEVVGNIHDNLELIKGK